MDDELKNTISTNDIEKFKKIIGERKEKFERTSKLRVAITNGTKFRREAGKSLNDIKKELTSQDEFVRKFVYEFSKDMEYEKSPELIALMGIREERRDKENLGTALLRPTVAQHLEPLLELEEKEKNGTATKEELEEKKNRERRLGQKWIVKLKISKKEAEIKSLKEKLKGLNENSPEYAQIMAQIAKAEIELSALQSEYADVLMKMSELISASIQKKLDKENAGYTPKHWNGKISNPKEGYVPRHAAKIESENPTPPEASEGQAPKTPGGVAVEPAARPIVEVEGQPRVRGNLNPSAQTIRFVERGRSEELPAVKKNFFQKMWDKIKEKWYKITNRNIVEEVHETKITPDEKPQEVQSGASGKKTLPKEKKYAEKIKAMSIEELANFYKDKDSKDGKGRMDKIAKFMTLRDKNDEKGFNELLNTISKEIKLECAVYIKKADEMAAKEDNKKLREIQEKINENKGILQEGKNKLQTIIADLGKKKSEIDTFVMQSATQQHKEPMKNGNQPKAVTEKVDATIQNLNAVKQNGNKRQVQVARQIKFNAQAQMQDAQRKQARRNFNRRPYDAKPRQINNDGRE